MPRLVIVLPLSPLHVGDSFAVTEWPLHITVLSPFLTDADPAAIAEAIASIQMPDASVVVRAGHDEMFGRRENIPVTIIDDNEALTRLHDDLITAIRPLAAVPDEPAFTGTEFRPHVTLKGHNRVQEDDRIAVTQIALVDMAPRASALGRTVLAVCDISVRGASEVGEHDARVPAPAVRIQGAPLL